MKTEQLCLQILIGLGLVLALGSNSCKKQVPVDDRSAAPPVLVSPSDRELADRSFFKGDYAAAAELYGSFLEKNPDAEDGETALFRLAISYAFLDDPTHEFVRTEALLQQILGETESLHAPEAELIVRFVNEIRALRAAEAIGGREVKQLLAALEKSGRLESRRNELEVADLSFGRGDYEAAVLAYTRYLANYPEAEERDRALFHLAISHALPDSPVYDPEKAEDLLKELISDPYSTQRPEAELILGLVTEIKGLRAENSEKSQAIQKLAAELEKLKEIDLKIQPSSQPN